MYIYRIWHEGAPRWAMQGEDGEALELLEAMSFEQLVGAYERGLAGVGELGALEDVELLAPSTPTKIICIGLNYKHHAEEMNKTVPDEPLMFMKPVSALLRPGGDVELPEQSSLVHHEGELAMVVGKRAKGVSERRILGVHVSKTIAAPIVTVLGMELGSVIAFAVITESIFAWPGMGKLIIDSINRLDRPVVAAYLLVITFMFIMINLVVDLLYTVLDPRVRLGGRT